MKHITFFIFLFLLLSCNSNDDDKSNEPCGDSIIVNANLFQQESPNDFTILNAEIIEDCMRISIVAGGCDASTWQASLITDGLQTAAIPPGRLLRFNFINAEDCEAAFTITYEFYLGNENETIIYSLEDWDGELIHNE